MAVNEKHEEWLMFTPILHKKNKMPGKKKGRVPFQLATAYLHWS
jgi:hypothetical protein